MTKSFDKIENILSGDTISIPKKCLGQSIVSELLERAELLGCKLILVEYGVYYFRDIIPELRQQAIDTFMGLDM